MHCTCAYDTMLFVVTQHITLRDGRIPMGRKDSHVREGFTWEERIHMLVKDSYGREGFTC